MTLIELNIRVFEIIIRTFSKHSNHNHSLQCIGNIQELTFLGNSTRSKDVIKFLNILSEVFYSEFDFVRWKLTDYKASWMKEGRDQEYMTDAVVLLLNVSQKYAS